MKLDNYFVIKARDPFTGKEGIVGQGTWTLSTGSMQGVRRYDTVETATRTVLQNLGKGCFGRYNHNTGERKPLIDIEILEVESVVTSRRKISPSKIKEV